MKIIYNLSKVVFLTLFVMMANSCEEQWDLKDGGSLGAIMYPESDIAYLYQVTDQVTVNLNTYSNEGVTISAINVTKQLFTSGGNSDPVVIDVSGDQFTQTRAELFADVPVGGQVLTEDDLTAGDYWILSYKMTLSDGRVMNIGRKTNIAFSCPSNIAGTFDAFTTGAGNYPEGNIPGLYWDGVGEVTITATAVEGVYEISEITGEFYNLFWGGNPESGTFRDVCGNYSIDIKTDQWGDTISATVTNNDDGTITIVWENTYGDYGTTILTPRD
jgi:hypothetical protein